MAPVTLTPVGVVRTDATPDEIRARKDVEGRVEIDPRLAEGLDGIDGYSHLFLLTYLDRLRPEQVGPLKVRPRKMVQKGFALEELPWRLQAVRQRGEAMQLAGDASTVYLIQEPSYAVFDFGAALLEAAARLPMGSFRVDEHPDREGNTAFRSVRFAGPHRLGYRGGFEVTLR